MTRSLCIHPNMQNRQNHDGYSGDGINTTLFLTRGNSSIHHSLPTPQMQFQKPLSNNSRTSCISADILIPGRGTPTKDAVVVIKEGKICYAGPQAEIPDAFIYEYSERTHVPVLMPGFWDCHMHFTGLAEATFPNLVLEHPALCGARMARSFYECLMAGCTSVKDLGSFSLEAGKAIEEGLILGPNIYAAGAAISQTGGSCDAYEIPIGCVLDRQGVNGGHPFEGVSQLALADGVEECRKMVRLQVRRGASLIKIITTGGIMSLKDNPQLRQYSDAELEVIFEEATRSGLAVAAHAHGKPGIISASKLGCSTIEHGTYIDDEAADTMKKHGTTLVATRLVLETLLDKLDTLGPELRAKVVKANEEHMESYRRCVRKGVKIALGTDICVADVANPIGAGNSGKEIIYAVRAGLSPLQAIEAATINSAETLGPRTPMKGLIKEGYDADVIALVRNPLEDIEVFADRANVSHVWKAGVMVKTPHFGHSSS